MTGTCGCIMGPPPGGRCGACGAFGQPLVYPTPVAPVPAPPPPRTPWPHPVGKPYAGPTEEDIRRIVREELDRDRALRDGENSRNGEGAS